MATRSLRHRSSRYSSPATFGEKEPAPKPAEEPPIKNGQQSSLDGWIEPAVRLAAPSFEDSRGLERVGVLENMQPLGTAPTQRLLQKLKLTYARPSPRATPAQTAEEVVTPVTETAEKMELASPIEEAVLEQQAETFPDHLQEPPPDTILISSPPRGRPPGRYSIDVPLLMGVSSVPFSYPLASTQHASPKPLSIQQQLRQDRLRTHVESAIQEAQQKGTPALVNGLQRIREDAHFNYDLWNVVEGVMHNSPSPDQFKTFKRYIKSGVKKHRRDSEMSASPYQPSPQIFHGLDSPNHRQRSPNSNHAHGPPSGYSEPPHPRLNLYFNRPPAAGAYGSEEMPVSPSTMAPHQLVPEPHTRPTRYVSTVSPHKRKRSGSASSLSSLSSPPSIYDSHQAPPWLDRGQGAAGSGPYESAGQRQDTSRETAGSRLRSAVGATNHLPQPVSEQLQAQVATLTKANASKRLKKTREEPEFDIDELSRRKRNYLDDSFHDYNTIPRPESSDREPVHGHPERAASNDEPPPPVIHPNRLVVSQASFTSMVNAEEGQTENLVNESRRKRAYDEIEADDLGFSSFSSLSPGPLLVPPPPPGVAKATSRAATPRSARFQAAPQKTRKSARVMVSPNKPKNGGITAGISRAGPGRDSRDAVIGNLNGADSGAEDNDEFCASCSGEGKLLCCDGCTNSFHHACLEPPLNPDEEVDGEWFCPRCIARRTKEAPSPAGLLGMVIRHVDDIIPKAYTLPLDIRDYFEGVRTGDEGEYDELGPPRTQNNVGRMNRAGFIEEPNYKETRDSKGNLIRCFQCNLTSNGRDIIPCDFCPARWHLDCIDPPLAVPPRRRADKPGGSWRCPLHADHDLMSGSRQAEKAPGDLGRIPKPRKPKNAMPLDVVGARGFRNNGIIEVELMKDQPDLDKLKEMQMNGRVYRVPEMGIRLDFIDRVKKSWYEDQSLPRLMDAPKKIRSRKYRPDGAVLHHPPEESLVKIRDPDFFTGANALAITETAKANLALRFKSIREQQTVLNLAQMSQGGIDGYSGDTLAELTNTLISEAPDKIVRATEKTEVDQLLQLQELISKRLAIVDRSRNSDSSAPVSRPMSNGRSNGNRFPPALDPNIDPALRGGGLGILSTTKTFADHEMPIDPALQMPTDAYTSGAKAINGRALDYGDAQDADDEGEVSRVPSHRSSKAAFQANHDVNRRWPADNYAPRDSTPTQYGSSANHPLSRHSFENGNAMDKMEMSP